MNEQNEIHRQLRIFVHGNMYKYQMKTNTKFHTHNFQI